MNPLPPGRTRRAPAPELSRVESFIAARFEAAPPLDESSAVVRAMLALAEKMSLESHDPLMLTDEYGEGYTDGKSVAARRIRAALSAALAADPEPLP